MGMRGDRQDAEKATQAVQVLTEPFAPSPVDILPLIKDHWDSCPLGLVCGAGCPAQDAKRKMCGRASKM